MEANLTGSVEIINDALGTSDGLIVWPISVDAIPEGLAALRGLTGIEAIEVPLREVEVPRYVYSENDDGQRVRELVVETVLEPVADAAWTARTPGGYDVTVYWREQRDLTIQEIAAALEMAQDEE